MNNIKKIQKILHGRNADEVFPEIDLTGLIIITCYDDDGIQFRGGINEHISAFGGTKILLLNKTNNEGFVPIKQYTLQKGLIDFINDHDIEVAIPKVEVSVNYHSGLEREYAWVVKTEIPHYPFDIMLEDKKYCQGIILEVEEIRKAMR